MTDQGISPQELAELKAKVDILVGKQEQEERAYEAYKKIKDDRRVAHDYILDRMETLQLTTCCSAEHGKKVNIINKKRKVGPKTVDFLDLIEERHGESERKFIEQEAKRRCVASEPKKTVKITKLTDVQTIAKPKGKSTDAKPNRYNEDSDSD